MTRWTVEANHSAHGVTFDVMGKGGRAARRRKQDLDSLQDALAFVMRYGAAGDSVKVIEPDGYARHIDPWSSSRRRLATQLSSIDY